MQRLLKNSFIIKKIKYTSNNFTYYSIFLGSFLYCTVKEDTFHNACQESDVRVRGKAFLLKIIFTTSSRSIAAAS